MAPGWMEYGTRRHGIKHWLDVSLAMIVLIVLLPLLGLIAAAIRLESRGPVVYAQERLGWHRRPFRMFKFRTMRVDAERESGPAWSWAGDPRVTAIGRFLRPLHLDELPQLWNVLRGEMSLVGPRPERAHFVEKYERVIPGYVERFDVLPGITGLSQIRNGYDESLETVRRKVRYDRLYVQRADALFDFQILLATAAHLASVAGTALAPEARRTLQHFPAAAGWFLGLRSVLPQTLKVPRAPARGILHRASTGTTGSAAAGTG